MVTEKGGEWSFDGIVVKLCRIPFDQARFYRAILYWGFLMKLPGFLVILISSLSACIPAFGELTEGEEGALLAAVEKDEVAAVVKYFDGGGDPNRVIEDLQVETGSTMLHHAAFAGSEGVVGVLLKNGADRFKQDRFWRYPIEDAPEGKAGDPVRKLLAVADKKVSEAGVRLDLLVRLLREGSYVDDSGRTDGKKISHYVEVNGKDPTDREMKAIKELGPRVEAMSKIPFDPDADEDRARAGGFRIAKVSVILKVELKSGTATWNVRSSKGPMAGGGATGDFKRQFGYWIKTGTGGWDE